MQTSIAKFRLVQLYRLNTESAKSVLAAKHKFVELFNAGFIDKQLLDTLGKVTFKSIERWNLQLRNSNDDYTVFERTERHDLGTSTLTKDEADMLLYYALKPSRPPKAEAVRQAVASLQMLGVSVKSTRTYVRFLDNFEAEHNDLWVMGREGEKALNDKVANYVDRDYDQLEVGDVIVADGHVLNFTILNPSTGRPCRMTMVLFIDMKSTMPLGFEIMPTENHICVASALRRSIILLGFKPQILYFDNGRAFKNQMFVKNPLDKGELPALFERLKVKYTFAKPYHGQSKNIEPFWRVIAELERMMTSYTGTDIAHKPAHLMRNEKMHVSIHKRLSGGTVPTIESVYQYMIAFFKSYSERPHQAGFYAGYSPSEIFNDSMSRISGLDSFETRKIQIEELNYLMLNSIERTTMRERIKLFGREYEHPALYGLKQKVLVKYDFFNTNEVLVFDQHERFICKAQQVGLVHPAAKFIGTGEDVNYLSEQLKLKQLNTQRTKQQFRELVDDNYIARRQAELQMEPLANQLPKQAEVKQLKAQATTAQFNNLLSAAAGEPLPQKTTNPVSPWSDLADDASPDDYIIKKEA